MLREIFDNLNLPCDKFEHYFGLYERHFQRFVGRSPRILEIGAGLGGSAEMWRTYFGAGTQIDGVDLAPQCADTDYLTMYAGDQGDPAFWRQHFEDKGAYYDIVMDTGSRDNPHEITTLLETFDMLRDGGVYWCEDTHTSYYFNDHVRDGGYKNPRSFTEFCKDIVDTLSAHHARHAVGVGPIDGPRVPAMLAAQFDRLQGVHFYDSVIVLDRGERFTFQQVIHSKKV